MSTYLKIAKIENERVKLIFEKIKTSDEVFDISKIPNYIFRFHEKKKNDDLENITLLNKQEIEEKIITLVDKTYELEVYIADRNRSVHPLGTLFPDVDLEEKLSGSSVPSAIFFIKYQDTWYALSVNRGYLFIDLFIDLDFPIDIARKIMNPEVKNTKERDITGVVYGRIQQFRTSQRVESQSIGTIWSGLDGYIEDDIRNSRVFIDIFNPKQKNTGVTINTSVEIRASLDYIGLLNGLTWIDTLSKLQLTTDQRKKFEQLDGIKEIKLNNPQLIESLEKEIAKNIQVSLLAGSNIDFDFSNEDFLAYQGMDIFCPKEKNKESHISFSTPPTSTEVLSSYYRESYLDPNVTDDAFLLQLKQTYFIAYQTGKRGKGLNDSLLYHLHGEITYDGKSYFLIDRRWYQLNDKFQNNLKKDFKELIDGPYFMTSGLPILEKWEAHINREGDYNELYKTKDGFIVGDRAFLNNIELADLLKFDGNQIYIYHNKVDFAGSTRDVCSQAFQSMNWITRLRKEGDIASVHEYYDAIISKHYSSGITLSISKDEFTNKLLDKNTKITFIIGYASRAPVNSRSRSNIAKFEILKLCKFDIRLFEFGLKVQWIKKD